MKRLVVSIIVLFLVLPTLYAHAETWEETYSKKLMYFYRYQYAYNLGHVHRKKGHIKPPRNGRPNRSEKEAQKYIDMLKAEKLYKSDKKIPLEPNAYNAEVARLCAKFFFGDRWYHNAYKLHNWPFGPSVDHNIDGGHYYYEKSFYDCQWYRDYERSRIIGADGYLYLLNPAFSIARPEKFPMEWRPWTIPVDYDMKTIPYCGMIDDDIMYDFRENDPFDKILTHNKEAVFLYVYDFEWFRERVADWVLHDKILHGYKSFGKEEDEVYSRLEYGPILNDPNDPALRVIRAQIFIKTYLAKLRLVKLLHPGYEWSEKVGDYNLRGYSSDTRAGIVSKAEELYPMEVSKTSMSFKEYEDIIKNISNDEYFESLNPLKSMLLRYHEGPDDFEGDRKIARAVEFDCISKDYYIYKMFVRSEKQYKNDVKRAIRGTDLSIALWSGVGSFGGARFRFTGGLKHAIPYFEVKDKVGNTHLEFGYCDGKRPRFKNVKHAPSQTTGIIYAGHMNRKEMKAYGKSVGKGKERLWKDALNGPFMIVSDRTYKRYGHKWFENKAGHILKKVDVTGAMVESYTRILAKMSIEQVKQLMDMDYLYYKKSEKDRIGRRTMTPSDQIEKIRTNVILKPSYNAIQQARNPITETLSETYAKADFYNSDGTFFVKNGAWTDIFEDVKTALAKDEKQFPGLSLRKLSYQTCNDGENGFMIRPGSVLYASIVWFSGCKRNRLKKPPWVSRWVRNAIAYPDPDWIYRHREEFIDKFLCMKKRTPRHMEMFFEIQSMKMKGEIEALKKKYKGKRFIDELRRFLGKRIPYMGYNPHLFMCYYNHIDRLREMSANYLTDFRFVLVPPAHQVERTTGTMDGNMMWSVGSWALTGMRSSFLVDNRLLKDYIMINHGTDATDLLTMGRLRKMHAPKGMFHRYYQELTDKLPSDDDKFLMGRYNAYVWMRGQRGFPIPMLREPGMFLQYALDEPGDVLDVRLVSRIMPGMTRFTNPSVVIAQFKNYGKIPVASSYYDDDTLKHYIRQYVEGNEYMKRSAAWLYSNVPLEEWTKCRAEDVIRTHLNLLLSIYPTDSHAFVITTGMNTPVMRERHRDNIELISNLYFGLSRI